MEYKQQLIENKRTLLEITICNVAIISECRAKRIINMTTESALKAETDAIKRNDLFWDAVGKTTNSWHDLIAVFREDGQDSVADLLTDITAQYNMNTTNNTAGASGVKNMTSKPKGKVYWRLVVDEDDIANKVIPKVQRDLVRTMQSSAFQESNTSIVLELNSLCFFDQDVIGQVLYNKWDSQQERMNKLFQIISTLTPENILSCLEALCNLKDQPNASERFRQVFSSKIEGSVCKTYI